MTTVERVVRLKDVTEILKGLDCELKISIELLYKQWIRLEDDIKRLEKEMAKQAKHDPLEALYRSVPGIGPLAARILSNELGDMSQFQNVRGLYSYTGLTPGEYSSGEKVYRGRISKQGNPRLRHVLVEAAWKAVRIDPTMKEFFERIARKSGKKRAIVASARKLIGKARAVIRDSKKYEVKHKEAA